MAFRVRVCRKKDVPKGQVRAFAIEGIDIPIMMANLEGEFYATTSMCPHEDVSLTGGEYKGAQITCPGHSYKFDLRTGECLHDKKLRLQTYPVFILGDDLWVDLF